jgi:hypothetical protein
VISPDGALFAPRQRGISPMIEPLWVLLRWWPKVACFLNGGRHLAEGVPREVGFEGLLHLDHFTSTPLNPTTKAADLNKNPFVRKAGH